jgi:hypothetical protein
MISLPLLWRSARVFLRALWKALRQFFHESTGVLFAMFAFSGGVAVWRQWHHARVPWLLALAAGYALMMAAFAVTAFRSARKVR